MKRLYVIAALPLIFIATWWLGALPASTTSASHLDQAILKLSEKLLYAVKTESATDSLEKELASLNMDNLITGLSNDAARKAFWINIYNSFYQVLAIREKKTRPGIYKEKLIPVAGHSFSLDDIEHGILRKYRWKYSMGYLPQFLPSKLIKRLAVSKIDYRIHFTLNCGAKSCPPIAFYEYEKLEKQLDIATKVFFKSETDIDTVKKQIATSKILQWFKGDFGGKKGIRSLLSKIFNQDFGSYSIKFKDYDWSGQLKNYSSE
ncbi:MAG: DUF547 domain-containing protein [Sphingobacteriales bacterium]|nr:DUF547 domain-containing protein [Sphingobacteriales bacterium]